MNFKDVEFYNSENVLLESDKKNTLISDFNKFINNDENVVIGMENADIDTFFKRCDNKVVVRNYSLNNEELKIDNIPADLYLVIIHGKKDTKIDDIYDLAKNIGNIYGNNGAFNLILDDNVENKYDVIIISNKTAK